MNNKLRIAFYARAFGIRGTAGTYLLINSFAKKFDHIVLAPSSNDEHLVFKSNIIKRHVLTRIIPKNFESEVISKLKEFMPDVIYMFNFPGWDKVLTLLEPRFQNVKFVLDVQTPLLVTDVVQRKQNQQDGCAVQSKLSLVTTFSKESVETWIPNCSVPIVEYPLGLDIGSFENALNNEKEGVPKKFVYIASLHPLRKTRDLIVAFENFSRKTPVNVSLDIFGSGPDYDNLNHLILNLNASSIINLKGLVEQATLAKLLSCYNCGIAWVPYEHYDKSPSLKIIEYMAAGIEVMASDTSAHKELADKGFEIVYFENNLSSFVCALLKYQSTRTVPSQIRKNRDLVRQFDYDYILDKSLLPKILKVLEGHSAGLAASNIISNRTAILHDNDIFRLSNSKQLRIVLLVNSLAVGKGGAEKVAVNLANEMQRRGHFVYVAYQNLGAPAYKINDEITLITFDKIREIRKYLIKLNPDVFFAFYFNRQLVNYYYLVYGTGIPFGMQECTNPDRLINNNWGAGKIDPITAAWERELVASGAARIRLVMPSYTNSFPRYINNSIRAFSNPCFNNAEIKNNSKIISNRKSIVMVNGFKSNKNFLTLLEAFNGLHFEYPAWVLKVIGHNNGDEPHKKKIRSYIAQNALQDKVIMTGAIDDVFSEYSSSHIHVIPSLSEGCPTCVLEAMSCGIPSIGFEDCPGTNELIKHGVNGLLASASDRVKGLRDSLSTLMRDENIRVKLAQQAKDDSIAFDPKNVYDQWEQLFYEAAQYKNDEDRLFREQLTINSEAALHLRRMREFYKMAINRDAV